MQEIIAGLAALFIVWAVFFGPRLKDLRRNRRR
jgi:hypothetical protein